jgi:hypothetical protein
VNGGLGVFLGFKRMQKTVLLRERLRRTSKWGKMKQASSTINKNIFIFARARAGLPATIPGIGELCVRQAGVLSRILLLVLAYSTGLIGALAAGESAVTAKTFDQALHSKNISDRLSAAQVVGQPGAVMTTKQMRELRNSESNALVHREINKTMVSSGLTDQGREFIASLQNDADPMVRQGATQLLGNYAYNKSVESALIQCLGSETVAGVRYACALSLGLSRSSKAIDALDKASTDADPNLRRQVAFSLGRFSDRRAKQIVNRLRHDSDASVRQMAGEKQ